MVYKILKLKIRFVLMSYKLIFQYPWLIFGGFLESTALILSFFIFWQIVLIGQNFGGWILPEILIFTSLGYFCWGLASFFFSGIWGLPEKIIEGDIERWLCRPVHHPLLGIIFEDIWIGGSAYLIVSIVLFIYVTTYYSIIYSLEQILMTFGMIIMGMTCLYLLYGTITALLGFTIGRAGIFQQIFESIEDNFTRIPATTLPSGVKTFLTIGLPVALISAWPSELLLGKISLYEGLSIFFVQLVLAVLWSLSFLLVWRTGIRKYESSSN
ncbi:MAG: ABC-2 family transporter protein [Candidatus Hodarchaeales archaeon]